MNRVLNARQIVEISDSLQKHIALTSNPTTSNQMSMTFAFPRFTVVVDYDLDEILTILFEPQTKFDETFNPAELLVACQDLIADAGLFDDIDPTVEEFTFGYMFDEGEIPYFSTNSAENYAKFLVRKYNENLEGMPAYFCQYRILKRFS